VPERAARVTPTRGYPMRRAGRGTVRRRGDSVPARSIPPDVPAPGPFDVGEISERLTLIEFTWSHHGRMQPVVFVRRELLD
jgi:hypothetical protein